MNNRRTVILTICASLLFGAYPACYLRSRVLGAAELERAQKALAREDTIAAVEILGSLIASGKAPPEAFARLGALRRLGGTIKGRLLSQIVLEKGAARYPSSPLILLELGKTYYEQTFYPDAERVFLSVIDLDSSFCEAFYYLGINSLRKWRRNRSFRDELLAAKSRLARAISCNPDCADWLFQYAFSLYASGEKKISQKVCEEISQMWTEEPWPYFLSGTIAFETSHYEASAMSFQRGLSLLGKGQREAYLDISTFLEGEGLERYQSASRQKKKAVRNAFWAEHDPDPTTPLNELQLEHLSRSFLAELYFGISDQKKRGWETDRGRSLVKFGWPSKVEYSLGSGLTGRIEEWIYQRGNDTFRLTFIDEFLNDNYSVPIRESAMAQELYRRPHESTLRLEPIFIPCTPDIIVFKNSATSASIYTVVKIRVDSIVGSSAEHPLPSIIFRSAFFDREWQNPMRFSDTLSVSKLRSVRDNDSNSIFMIKKRDMPFDFYHGAFALEDRSALMRSLFRADIDALRYLGSKLTLSDIFLYRESGDTSCVFLERGGLKMTPNPAHVYREGEKLGVYFEIYNLRLSHSTCRYKVSYLIFESKEKPSRFWEAVRRGLRRVLGSSVNDEPAISQTIQRMGSRHTENENLFINIDSLSEGSYVLKVCVTDDRSGELTENTEVFSKASSDRSLR